MWLVVAGVLGALSILLGAFGAHVLEGVLDVSVLDTYQTAVRYQMFHSLFLLGIGILKQEPKGKSKQLDIAGWSAFIGVILFSGSLYLVVATGISVFGAVTPIGGVLLVVSWLMLAWYAKGS